MNTAACIIAGASVLVGVGNVYNLRRINRAVRQINETRAEMDRIRNRAR